MNCDKPVSSLYQVYQYEVLKEYMSQADVGITSVIHKKECLVPFNKNPLKTQLPGIAINSYVYFYKMSNIKISCLFQDKIFVFHS